MDEDQTCPFMRLPVELRLHIYSYALVDTPAITVGSALLTGSAPDVVHRLYGDKRTPTPGLPQNHEPVIEPSYDPSLLSLVNPALIPLTPATICPPEHPTTLPHSTLASLHLTNRQIKHELDSHFSRSRNPSTSLFCSYPSGLHILKTLAPSVLAQAKSLHIAGSYSSRGFSASRAACLGSTTHPPFIDERFNGGFTPNSPGQLGSLIASLFGPKPSHPGLRHLELRMYYPGLDSYSVVWGDDNSPTCVALRNIYAGEVGIEVWRGQRGTGVHLTATRPSREDEEMLKERGEKSKRTVSTTWRRLEEGRRGEAACGSWVVDPRWPDWALLDNKAGDVVFTEHER